MEPLEIGQTFPALAADAVDGSHFSLPDDLEDVRAVIVFYRGHW